MVTYSTRPRAGRRRDVELLNVFSMILGPEVRLAEKILG